MDPRGSRQGHVYRPYSICISTRLKPSGVGAGPGRGPRQGPVASVRPGAAFGGRHGLECGRAGGTTYKMGVGRGEVLRTSIVLNGLLGPLNPPLM